MMSVRSITAVNRTVCASSAHDNAEHGVLPDRRSATAVDSVDSVRQSPRVIASHNRETYAHLVDHGARPDRVKQGAVLRASASVAPLLIVLTRPAAPGWGIALGVCLPLVFAASVVLREARVGVRRDTSFAWKSAGVLAALGLLGAFAHAIVGPGLYGGVWLMLLGHRWRDLPVVLCGAALAVFGAVVAWWGVAAESLAAVLLAQGAAAAVVGAAIWWGLRRR